MVPAPIERTELRGHRQPIGKSAALTEGSRNSTHAHYARELGNSTRTGLGEGLLVHLSPPMRVSISFRSVPNDPYVDVLNQ